MALLRDTLAKARGDHADAEECRGQLMADLEQSAKEMEATVNALLHKLWLHVMVVYIASISTPLILIQLFNYQCLHYFVAKQH